jgi:hypothetical protein
MVIVLLKKRKRRRRGEVMGRGSEDSRSKCGNNYAPFTKLYHTPFLTFKTLISSEASGLLTGSG